MGSGGDEERRGHDREGREETDRGEWCGEFQSVDWGLGFIQGGVYAGTAWFSVGRSDAADVSGPLQSVLDKSWI